MQPEGFSCQHACRICCNARSLCIGLKAGRRQKASNVLEQSSRTWRRSVIFHRHQVSCCCRPGTIACACGTPRGKSMTG